MTASKTWPRLDHRSDGSILIDRRTAPLFSRRNYETQESAGSRMLVIILLMMALQSSAAPAAPATASLMPEWLTISPIFVTPQLRPHDDGTCFGYAWQLGWRGTYFAVGGFPRVYLGGVGGVPAGEVITSAKLVLRSTVTSGTDLDHAPVWVHGQTPDWGNAGHLPGPRGRLISADLTDLNATSGLVAAGGDVTFNSTPSL